MAAPGAGSLGQFDPVPVSARPSYQIVHNCQSMSANSLAGSGDVATARGGVKVAE